MVEHNAELGDEIIATRIQQGNTDALGILIDRYETKLKRYGMRFLAYDDDIEDAVQEIFIKAYKNIQSFDANRKFSSWIYRIAHNEFINHIRLHARDPLPFLDFEVDTLIPHPFSDDTPESDLEKKETKELMDKALKKLSPKYREILLLFYYEELSYEEIADILRIPKTTVGVRLNRAKKELKKHL